MYSINWFSMLLYIKPIPNFKLNEEYTGLVIMCTQVIHIKDSTNSPDEVYIGRGGKGFIGKFGNPIIKGELCCVCNNIHVTNGSTLQCFRLYVDNRMKNDSQFRNDVNELKGKILVCFCKPKPCHGDIYKDILDNNSIW